MKKFLRNKKIKFTTGFTLVETLVAVSIFTFSILGLLLILTQGISDTGYAKRKMTASYLAQEGIEYVRNVRDTLVLYNNNSSGWSDFKEELSDADCEDGCYVNENFSFFECTSSTCSNAPILYDTTSSKYGYVSGQASGFYRLIQTTLVDTDEIEVSSTVFWTQGSGNYSITVSENIYNWIE